MYVFENFGGVSVCKFSTMIVTCDGNGQGIMFLLMCLGTAIVTPTEALLWTDGRYFLQAEKELDENWTLMRDGMVNLYK